LPAILTGLRNGLSLAWMFMVAAELIAASRGLGYLLSDGRETSRADIVLAAIVLLALLGKLSDMAMLALERRLLAWRDTHCARPDDRSGHMSFLQIEVDDKRFGAAPGAAQSAPVDARGRDRQPAGRQRLRQEHPAVHRGRPGPRLRGARAPGRPRRCRDRTPASASCSRSRACFPG
jgi:hypothetical protein